MFAASHSTHLHLVTSSEWLFTLMVLVTQKTPSRQSLLKVWGVNMTPYCPGRFNARWRLLLSTSRRTKRRERMLFGPFCLRKKVFPGQHLILNRARGTEILCLTRSWRKNASLLMIRYFCKLKLRQTEKGSWTTSANKWINALPQFSLTALSCKFGCNVGLLDCFKFMEILI